MSLLKNNNKENLESILSGSVPQPKQRQISKPRKYSSLGRFARKLGYGALISAALISPVTSAAQEYPLVESNQPKVVEQSSTVEKSTPASETRQRVLIPYSDVGWPQKYLEWLIDPVNIVTKPFYMEKREWGAVGLGTGLILATIPLDKTVRDAMDEKGSEALDKIRHYYTGDALKVASGAMFVGGSLIYVLGGIENVKGIGEKIADSGVLTLESVFYATRLSFALKELTNRERPLFAKNQYEFHGPGGKTRGPTSGFVSTDTAAAFAFAATLSEIWDSELPWIKWPLYGAATLVGLQRIDRKKHWLSDVVGGALLGYGTGKGVAGLHYPSGTKVVVEPYVGEEIGIRLTVRY